MWTRYHHRPATSRATIRKKCLVFVNTYDRLDRSQSHVASRLVSLSGGSEPFLV
jgi:hypothetical protein